MTAVRPLLRTWMARAVGQRAGGAYLSQQPNRPIVPFDHRTTISGSSQRHANGPLPPASLQRALQWRHDLKSILDRMTHQPSIRA
jgi:hypothetical protein